MAAWKVEGALDSPSVVVLGHVVSITYQDLVMDPCQNLVCPEDHKMQRFLCLC